jgi:hypothetical protein
MESEGRGRSRDDNRKVFIAEGEPRQHKSIDRLDDGLDSDIDRNLMPPPPKSMKMGKVQRRSRCEDLSATALMVKLRDLSQSMIQEGDSLIAIESPTYINLTAPPPSPVEREKLRAAERRTLRRRGRYQDLFASAALAQQGISRPVVEGDTIEVNPPAPSPSPAHTELVGRAEAWEIYNTSVVEVDRLDPEHITQLQGPAAVVPMVEKPVEAGRSETWDAMMSPSDPLMTLLRLPILDHAAGQTTDRAFKSAGVLDTSRLPTLGSFDRLPSPITPICSPKDKGKARISHDNSQNVSLPGIEAFDRLAGLAPRYEPTPFLHPPHADTGPPRLDSFGYRWPPLKGDSHVRSLEFEEPSTRLRREGQYMALEMLADVAENRIAKINKQEGSIAWSTPPLTPPSTSLIPTTTPSACSSPTASLLKSLPSATHRTVTDAEEPIKRRKIVVQPARSYGRKPTAVPDEESDTDALPHISDSDAEDCIMVDVPEERARTTACIVQREDGQVVKLVCPDCHKEDFLAPQGFISHCRISHKRRFKNFEEAAVAAGQQIKPTVGRKRKRAQGKRGVKTRKSKK